jgi:hypothetical protein
MRRQSNPWLRSESAAAAHIVSQGNDHFQILTKLFFRSVFKNENWREDVRKKCTSHDHRRSYALLKITDPLAGITYLSWGNEYLGQEMSYPPQGNYYLAKGISYPRAGMS